MSPRVAPTVRRVAGFARPATRPATTPRPPTPRRATTRSSGVRPQTAAPRRATAAVPVHPRTQTARGVRPNAKAVPAPRSRVTAIRAQARRPRGLHRLALEGPRHAVAALGRIAVRLVEHGKRVLRRTTRRHTTALPHVALGVVLTVAVLTAPPRIAAGELPFVDREPVATVPAPLPSADPTPGSTLAPEAVSSPAPLPAGADDAAARALCDGEPVAPVDLRDEVRATAIARVLLRDLEAPQNAAMIAAVRTWIRAEGWDHGYLYNNNPLGMVVRGPMVCGIWNRVGVAILTTPEEGMRLAAIRLQRPVNRIYGYRRIVDAARAGDARGFLQAVAASDWSGVSHYGCTADRSGVSRLEELWALTDPLRARSLPCR